MYNSETKKHFILLHGAWHSNFIWKQIAKDLQQLGHQVYTPNLPGHGNNYKNFKEINLASYLAEVEKLINSISPSKIVLVGHSMAGIIISQIAENMPDRIEKLVYLTAFIPDNNGSLIDEESKAIQPSVALEVQIDEENYRISIKNSSKFKELFYTFCPQELYADIFTQIGDQPLQPFIDKVTLTDQKFGSVPKIYIECLEDKAISIHDQRRMQAKISCQVASLNSDHSPFFSHNQELLKILCEIN